MGGQWFIIQSRESNHNYVVPCALIALLVDMR